MATDGWGVAEWKITSTRVFRDLFKHATYWQVERAQHDAGVQMETWKQYDLRPTNMSHANGYPVELPRWWRWQNTYEVQTAVAYIGWGGASVAAGIYAVHFDGNGTLSFGGDARLAAPLSYDPVARRGRYLFNVSAPTSGVSIRIMTTDPSAPRSRASTSTRPTPPWPPSPSTPTSSMLSTARGCFAIAGGRSSTATTITRTTFDPLGAIGALPPR